MSPANSEDESSPLLVTPPKPQSPRLTGTHPLPWTLGLGITTGLRLF